MFQTAYSFHLALEDLRQYESIDLPSGHYVVLASANESQMKALSGLKLLEDMEY